MSSIKTFNPTTEHMGKGLKRDIWVLAGCWATVLTASTLITSASPLAAVSIGINRSVAPFTIGMFLIGAALISAYSAQIFTALGRAKGFGFGCAFAGLGIAELCLALAFIAAAPTKRTKMADVRAPRNMLLRNLETASSVWPPTRDGVSLESLLEKRTVLEAFDEKAACWQTGTLIAFSIPNSLFLFNKKLCPPQ